MKVGPSAPASLLRTPDFDSYRCDHTVVGADVVSSTTIEIRWSDGRVDRHHPWTLRENATDPATTSPVTRERLTDVATWADDVAVASAAVAPDGRSLAIQWCPDGLVADYDGGWLRHLGDRSWHPDSIRPPIELWRSSTGEPPTFNGPAYLIDDGVLSDALRALAGHGLIRLRDLPVERDGVLDVGRRIGVVRPTQFGPDFDVVARPDADSQAYTSTGLGPHTDIPTRENPAGLQLLHCLVNTVSGGESLMVDGFAVAEYLRVDEPDTFEALTSLRWVWANRSTATDIRWSAPVIGLDPGGSGSVDEIRLANTLRLFPDMDHDDVDLAYRAVRRFTRICDSPEFRVMFPFRAGDCVVFDNRRVLHGRESFTDVAGERHLRGCYVDRDDLYARLRMLARAERQRSLAGADHWNRDLDGGDIGPRHGGGGAVRRFGRTNDVGPGVPRRPVGDRDCRGHQGRTLG